MTNPSYEREAIRNLQRYLRHLSYFDEDIPPLPVSGLWDPNTRDALIAFQQKNQLPPTGTADERTWNLLHDLYRSSMEEKSPPLGMPVFPRLPEHSSLRQGDVGFSVTAVQYMLDELTVEFEELDGIPQNGIFGPETARAVKEFQRRTLLPETGEVDKKTWDILVRSYESVANDIKQ